MGRPQVILGRAAGGRSGGRTRCALFDHARSYHVASPDNSDTHDSNAGRGQASIRPQDCASARPARPARQRRRSHKLHIGGFSTRPETSCGGIGGGPEPAELQATQWRLRWRTGDVAQRRRWRTGAGRHRGSPLRLGVCALLDWETCRTAPLACSDWSEVGQSRLDRVEGGGDNGSRVGRAVIQDVPLREF
jgi:hypothetical protein